MREIRLCGLANLDVLLSWTGRTSSPQLGAMAKSAIDGDISSSSFNETTPLSLRNTPRCQTSPGLVLQTRILYLVLFCEAISAMIIYPFVNQLLISKGIEEKKVGYFSGVINGVFFLTQGATVVIWQLASEVFGRRRVLLIAPFGLGVTMLGFGFANTLWGLLVARAFQGVFDGGVSVAKTMLIELTDSSNRADVMAMVTVTTLFGVSISPFIGGAFSEPVHNWPNTFGKIQLLQEKPYLLPCILCAVLCFVSFELAVAGLRETHPSLKNRASIEAPRPGHVLRRPPLPRISTVLTGNVFILLLLGGIYTLAVGSSRTLQALIWSTSIENGGLDLSAYKIGFLSTLFRFPGAIFQFFFLGKLTRYFGSRNGILFSFFVSLLALFSFPFQTYFARINGAVDWKVYGWIVWQQFVCLNLVSVGNAALMIHAAAVSTPSSMASIEGLLQLVQAVTRGLAPTVSSSLFAYGNMSGAGSGYGGGYLVYLVLGVMYVGAGGLALVLPKA
ncbi:major facilitator superfamily domain-containing protein [Flagelloscypha sp. PMI_526]|nr:major facilitator superfamily domain-containing protein [Flagelloscypha sp. PMI_526]